MSKGETDPTTIIIIINLTFWAMEHPHPVEHQTNHSVQEDLGQQHQQPEAASRPSVHAFVLHLAVPGIQWETGNNE